MQVAGIQEHIVEAQQAMEDHDNYSIKDSSRYWLNKPTREWRGDPGIQACRYDWKVGVRVFQSTTIAEWTSLLR